MLLANMAEGIADEPDEVNKVGLVSIQSECIFNNAEICATRVTPYFFFQHSQPSLSAVFVLEVIERRRLLTGTLGNNQARVHTLTEDVQKHVASGVPDTISVKEINEKPANSAIKVHV